MKLKKPIFSILTFLLGIILLYITRRFVVLIVSSIFLSYVIAPLYKILKKILVNKSLSALLSELLFFTLLILLSIFVVNSIFSQVRSLSSSFISETFFSTNDTLFNFSQIPIDFENPFTQETLGNLFELSQDMIFSTPFLLIDTFLLMFLTYYFIKDSKQVFNVFIKMIPYKHRRTVSRFFRRISNMAKEIIYGYFLTAIFIGLLLFVLLTLLKITYSVDYAIMSSIASLFPIFGSWIVPIVLSIYYYSKNNYVVSIVLFIFAILVSFLSKIFRVVISRKKEEIHPILFLLGVFVGFYSLGFLGFLTGPIVFGALQVGVEEVFRKT